MKKLAFILGTSVALATSAYAQTAADVAATDSLNSNAEIRITESVVTATPVAEGEARIDEKVTVTEVAPNQTPNQAPSQAAAPLAQEAQGLWVGTVPCASCPGIDVKLTLNADGTFTMNESYRESADGEFSTSGTASYTATNGVLTLTTADNESRHLLLKDGQLLYIDAEGNARADYMLKRAQ
ncbi:copper resistance protein NlpE [Oligella urethralis]|uniref:copper resistance protein NlpE n=1 Tax=Oligella urethralis TaxID=90245 RepID=UPI002889B332|nr:copper resistance protein NlpE [Oligella urethralis]